MNQTQKFARELLEFLLPHFVTAGRAATVIQQQLHPDFEPTQKEGSRFSQALTHADGIVQTYIGTALLAHYPGIRFIGEEADAVSHYFTPKRPNPTYNVTLDPVNGTIFFKNGLDLWDIIVTIREGDRLIGAAVYLPVKEQCCLAIEGLGAYLVSAPRLFEKHDWLSFHFEKNTREQVLFGHRLSPSLHKRLSDTGLRVIDVITEYRAENTTWKFATNRLFTGEVSAIIKENVSLIDWGAIAFIAGEAGGKASDFAGNPPVYDPQTLCTPSLLASSSPILHEKLLRAINT